MRAIRSYESLLRGLADIFYPRFRQSGQSARMLGLILARPESKLGQSVATAQHEYWHHRSGEHIDFFWPGYEQDWSFDPKLFNGFRREFESATRWQYSGGSELILLDAVYDPNYKSDSCPFGRANLDFTAALCIDLDSDEVVKRAGSIARLFEGIFRAAEEGLGKNPTRRYAHKAGVTSGSRALWAIVVAFLPEPIRELLLGKHRIPIARSIARAE